MAELLVLITMLLPLALFVLSICLIVCFFKINTNVRIIRELIELKVTGKRPGETKDTNEWGV